MELQIKSITSGGINNDKIYAFLKDIVCLNVQMEYRMLFIASVLVYRYIKSFILSIYYLCTCRQNNLFVNFAKHFICHSFQTNKMLSLTI